LIGNFDQLFGPIGAVFFPAATHLDASGDKEGLRLIYLKGSKMLLLAAVATGSIGWIWAGDFFRLWIGPHLVDGGEYPSVVVLFRLLIAAAVLTTGQRIGYQVLMATRRMKLLAQILALEAALNLILCLCLIHTFGLIGACLAALLPAAIIQGVLLPAVLCRLLSIHPLSFLRGVYFRPLIVGLALYFSLSFFQHSSTNAGSWSVLILYGAISGGMAIILLFFVGLDNGERRKILREPLRRLKARFSIASALDTHKEEP
jgi:O-antigen/teichoic acid export membrane protein